MPEDLTGRGIIRNDIPARIPGEEQLASGGQHAVADVAAAIHRRVAVEHLEFFPDVDEIALAARELIENLPGRDTVSVLNVDDDRVMSMAKVAPGRIVTFGVGATADFRAEEIEDRGAEGSAFTLISPEGSARLALSLVGRHNVTNALGALAAAGQWGVGVREASEVLPRMKPAAMRGEVLHFAEGFTVINDCYNSSPAAMASMIDLLASTPGYRRRILASGEMLELGPSSAELHAESGRYAAAKNIDWIIGVQGNSEELVRAAAASGGASTEAQFFSTSQEAAEFLSAFASRGDLILVKGSRGVRMERIVEALRTKHPLRDAAAGVTSNAGQH